MRSFTALSDAGHGARFRCQGWHGLPTWARWVSLSVALSLVRGTAVQRKSGRPVPEAATAQVGERETEDLKVPGSIPDLGTFVIPSLRHEPSTL